MAILSTHRRRSVVPQTALPRTQVGQSQGRLAGIWGWFTMRDVDQTTKNARFLLIEIFWSSFLSAAATFNAAFAVRLGASNQEIGWLTSMPALLAFLVTIPAGRYFSRNKTWMPLILRSLFTYRLGFLVVALLPWLPFAAKDALLIWTLIAFTVPAHFFAVGWNSMLADAIPEANRARIFAVRNGLAAVALTGGIFAAGLWLEWTPFPYNYQILYSVGFVASMISLHYIAKIRLPDKEQQGLADAVPAASQLTLGQRWQQIFGAQGLFRSQPDFLRITFNTFVHGLGLWMVAPLYVLYFVRELGAHEGWLGLNGMLANLTPVLGYYLWQKAIVRWGENPVLKLSISIIGIYPLLVGASPNLALILAWTALNGLIAPGVALGHFPMLLKICPAEDRPLYMSVYTTIMNLGAFIMPLIGVALASLFGLMPVLMAGGILCLVGSASFVIWPLRTVDSLSVRRGIVEA